MLPLENGQHNEIGAVTGEATAQVVALEPARALPHGIRLAAQGVSDKRCNWPKSLTESAGRV